MRASDRQRPSSDQVRHRIDPAATGDKVAFPYPAVAPLGTDAEAGGHPEQPAADIGPGLMARGSSPTTAPAGNPTRTRSYLWAGAAVVVVLGLILAAM